MNSFLIRWAINAVALYAAVALVPGISPQNPDWVSYIWLALIFGIVNALLNPLLKLLTCPLILLTLGLFTLLINALLFWIAGWVGQQFGVGFTVDGFWAALLGSIVVSLVSIVLALLVGDPDKNRERSRS